MNVRNPTTTVEAFDEATMATVGNVSFATTLLVD
jgi:hypothetical protein